MFLLLFFLSFSSEVCHSQMIYSRMVPYDPRYVLHRPPVRRSAMEALERLRMPVARYFPQVDTQVASAPYQPPASAPLSGYQLSADDIYALPPQWTDEFMQQLPERTEDENDYGNYEYENVFAPVYRPGTFAEEVYAQQEPVAEPEPSDNAYNEYMSNYFFGVPEPMENAAQPEQFDLQRRSDISVPNNNRNQGVIPLASLLEANKNANATSSETTVPPSVPLPSQVPPQVQMTAVPSAPEKKEIKSMVIPEPAAAASREDRDDIWRDLGQKEEPLFRPLQNSQRTTWEVLTRAKNSVQKRPIPLLKKMIQSGQQQQIVDPLTEELKSLKKEHKV